MHDTWVKDGARYPRQQWSVFNRAIRTNNDVEGWHTRLNRLARKNSLPMYSLIDLLEEEAEYAKHETRLVSAGKLKRYQREAFRDCQTKIMELWDRYTDDDTFDAISLMSAISKVQIGGNQED